MKLDQLKLEQKRQLVNAIFYAVLAVVWVILFWYRGQLNELLCIAALAFLGIGGMHLGRYFKMKKIIQAEMDRLNSQSEAEEE